jgi:hypothetical protein
MSLPGERCFAMMVARLRGFSHVSPISRGQGVYRI